jgi:hypothetical protein
LRSWRKVNPITVFELLVYGYMTGKYSSREIENACRTDIRFMYILGSEPVPDHSTISRFQNERLTEVIEDLFYQLVMKLYELGEIKFKNIFVDGTKIEADANRYTFVWRKAIEKNNEKLNQKAESILPVICERYGINEYVSNAFLSLSITHKKYCSQYSITFLVWFFPNSIIIFPLKLNLI